MPHLPQDNSPQSWHRFFAMEGNNRAWDLANGSLDAAARSELLDAAHASAWHWQAVGTELNHMRAKMLLAEVHALAGHGATALAYAEEMRRYFLGKGDTPDWELAFAHAIYAHAAHAAGRPDLHGPAHAAAASAVAAIAGDEDRAIVLQTFRHVPAP
jgi:hypothetical protein